MLSNLSPPNPEEIIKQLPKSQSLTEKEKELIGVDQEIDTISERKNDLIKGLEDNQNRLQEIEQQQRPVFNEQKNLEAEDIKPEFNNLDESQEQEPERDENLPTLEDKINQEIIEISQQTNEYKREIESIEKKLSELNAQKQELLPEVKKLRAYHEAISAQITVMDEEKKTLLRVSRLRLGSPSAQIKRLEQKLEQLSQSGENAEDFKTEQERLTLKIESLKAKKAQLMQEYQRQKSGEDLRIQFMDGIIGQYEKALEAVNNGKAQEYYQQVREEAKSVIGSDESDEELGQLINWEETGKPRDQKPQLTNPNTSEILNTLETHDEGSKGLLEKQRKRFSDKILRISRKINSQARGVTALTGALTSLLVANIYTPSEQKNPQDFLEEKPDQKLSSVLNSQEPQEKQKPQKEVEKQPISSVNIDEVDPYSPPPWKQALQENPKESIKPLQNPILSEPPPVSTIGLKTNPNREIVGETTKDEATPNIESQPQELSDQEIINIGVNSGFPEDSIKELLKNPSARQDLLDVRYPTLKQDSDKDPRINAKDTAVKEWLESHLSDKSPFDISQRAQNAIEESGDRI